MTDMTPAQETAAPSRPWWVGCAIVAIGAFWLYGATLLPQGSTYAKVGPGVFVSLTGGGLVLLGLVLLVQIARGASFEAQESEDADANKPADWTAFATALIAASVPMYTMTRFGFIFTAGLLFALVTRAFGSRRLAVDFAIGLVLASVCWVGFSKLGVDLGAAWTTPKTWQGLLPRFSLT